MTGPAADTWHDQFLRQARWTQGVRSQLYRRARLLQAERVLDVGCGTGAITRELARRARGEVIGLDIDPRMIEFARRPPSVPPAKLDARSPSGREEADRTPLVGGVTSISRSGREEADKALLVGGSAPIPPSGGDAPEGLGGRAPRYEQGDVQDLPYPDRHFDIVTCHFLLLWVADPLRAVREMVRVTLERGTVLICAEPDYGGRLDWPELPVRRWQIDGLRAQGADPLIGRQLRRLLVEAGLRAEVGIHPSVWNARALGEQFEAEWAWLRRDVGAVVDEGAFERARAQAKAAVDAGTRLVYMPVFYALGRKT